MKKVTIDQRKRVFDDFFKIEEAYLRYERFDGTMSSVVRRLNFERGDSVAAVIFDAQHEHIVLVKQFRYPAYEKGPGWITEIIAGMINKGESPENAIRREILEETGYKVSNLEHVSTFYLSPGGSSERILFYYAEVNDKANVSTRNGLPSEDEDIITVELAIDDALGQIENKKIVDAKTIIAIYWLRDRLTKGKTRENMLE
jgi:nudix-type nucleoside diphosphatase (YffH/AdpP family)